MLTREGQRCPWMQASLNVLQSVAVKHLRVCVYTRTHTHTHHTPAGMQALHSESVWGRSLKLNTHTRVFSHVVWGAMIRQCKIASWWRLNKPRPRTSATRTITWSRETHYRLCFASNATAPNRRTQCMVKYSVNEMRWCMVEHRTESDKKKKWECVPVSLWDGLAVAVCTIGSQVNTKALLFWNWNVTNW